LPPANRLPLWSLVLVRLVLAIEWIPMAALPTLLGLALNAQSSLSRRLAESEVAATAPRLALVSA
jgi:hypothetical protein